MNRKRILGRNKRTKKKRSLVNALFLGFIVLGIGFMSWAIFNIWTQTHYSDDSKPKSDTIPKTTVDEKSKLTEENKLKVESEPTLDKNLYPIYPVEGDNIGSLTMPSLKGRTIPIFQGTEDKELEKGIGHFSQSVLPGEKDNCVISGHRETAFRGIGELKIGDSLIVKTSAGTFTYAVSGTRIVHSDDKTVIVPTDHAVLTMTTCYPFNFVGSAPDRYIVSADLVKSR